MPDATPRLALPRLLPAQAQKHVTHNEALERLDALVQLRLTGLGTTQAPADPDEGEVHAVGAGASGDFAGQAGMLALRTGGGWDFVAPQPGWRAWDEGSATLRVFDGSAWVEVGAGDLQDLPGLGIAATSDATNRLSVSAPATLLSHAGGDHRLKVNKAATSATASLVFQSGFSGRAEFGLAGDNDFSVKVSADGAAWTEALRVTAATGKVGLPVGGTVGGALTGAGIVGSAAAGALVERGSGSGGSWTRFVDGTQICWISPALDQSLTGYVETTWTFPAAFLSGSLPVVQATARSGTTAAGREAAARFLRATGTASGATSAVLGVVNLSGAALQARIDAIVVGRWK